MTTKELWALWIVILHLITMMNKLCVKYPNIEPTKTVREYKRGIFSSFCLNSLCKWRKIIAFLIIASNLIVLLCSMFNRFGSLMKLMKNKDSNVNFYVSCNISKSNDISNLSNLYVMRVRETFCKYWSKSTINLLIGIKIWRRQNSER